jgi:ribonuclease-3
MGELLYLSKGEEKTGGRERDLLLANSFEALIGAIYIEHGMKAVKNFIIDHILIKLPKIIKEKLYLDPKTHLQELVQAEIGITPVYKVLKEEGPDHSKNFTLGVFLNDKMLAVGNGSSKQEAQVKAAQKALENWQE